jgi:hypothetical protein
MSEVHLDIVARERPCGPCVPFGFAMHAQADPSLLLAISDGVAASWVQSPSPPIRRPRGRPASVRSFLEQHHPPAAPSSTALSPRPLDPLKLFLRVNLGAPVLQACVASVGRSTPDSRLPPAFEKLIEDHFQANVQHHVLSVQAEAQLLGVRRQDVGARTMELAAAVHFGTRAFLASLLSHIRTEISLGRMKPVACVLWCMSDETTMPTSGQDFVAPTTAA